MWRSPEWRCPCDCSTPNTEAHLRTPRTDPPCVCRSRTQDKRRRKQWPSSGRPDKNVSGTPTCHFWREPSSARGTEDGRLLSTSCGHRAEAPLHLHTGSSRPHACQLLGFALIPSSPSAVYLMDEISSFPSLFFLVSVFLQAALLCGVQISA